MITHFLFFLLYVPMLAVGTQAATISEVTSKISSLSAKDRKEHLINGARKEGQVVMYGTLPVIQFAVLKTTFTSHYPFLDLTHHYDSRQTVLTRTMTEARAGRHAVDAIQVDVSYGYQLINAGLIHPYLLPGRQQFYNGTYDKDGYWYSMYHLTTALVYNTKLVQSQFVPLNYDDLLKSMWKGKLLLDPEAAYILAAMEHTWGREKAIEYLTNLSKQDLVFRRRGTLPTQLVAAGEYPIAIAINGETSAAGTGKSEKPQD